MIRINISESQKSKIKKLMWDDAVTAKTGILEELKNGKTRTYLKKYPKLYKILYDNSGAPKQDELKKIILSSRDGLKKYIHDIGEFKEEDGKEILEKVFKFENFSKRKVAYEILRVIKVDVCPYCNRQYVMTIKSGKVRAQLDHFYPKKKYPYLALSLFNLIPCCSVCNTSKSNLNTVKDPILYPYEEEFGYDVSFNVKVDDRKRNYAKVIQGVSDKFDVIIKNPSGKNAKKIDTQMEKLHLYELYNEHKPYIKDLFRNRYINTPERIKEIQKEFSELFGSEEEIKSVLYMSAIKKENWHTRPLSKLTHDIDVCIPE